MLGLMGKKIGMTQIFREDGSVVPVTVLSVDPNLVTAVKTRADHGYNAVQLGQGRKRKNRVNKAEQGFFKKQNLEPCARLQEFRTEKALEYKVGMKLSLDFLTKGNLVDVQGVSKGKGFQGVMKRHNFAGGNDSHGASVSHRVPGSVGMNTWPGRVIRGKRMPGHMGAEKVTVKNLEIVGVEAEQNLLLVKGAIPGSRNAAITIFPHAAAFENQALTGAISGAGTGAINGAPTTVGAPDKEVV